MVGGVVRVSLNPATLAFSSLRPASALTFIPVIETISAPKTFHEGATRHVGKEELEVRPSNLKTQPKIVSYSTESSGRVRHDDRGTAVWDWKMDTGMFAAMSATGLMRRLDVADLKMQEAPSLTLSVAGRDAGGGGDPYNSRGVQGGASLTRRTRLR